MKKQVSPTVIVIVIVVVVIVIALVAWKVFLTDKRTAPDAVPGTGSTPMGDPGETGLGADGTQTQGPTEDPNYNP